MAPPGLTGAANGQCADRPVVESARADRGELPPGGPGPPSSSLPAGDGTVHPHTACVPPALTEANSVLVTCPPISRTLFNCNGGRDSNDHSFVRRIKDSRGNRRSNAPKRLNRPACITAEPTGVEDADVTMVGDTIRKTGGMLRVIASTPRRPITVSIIQECDCISCLERFSYLTFPIRGVGGERCVLVASGREEVTAVTTHSSPHPGSTPASSTTSGRNCRLHLESRRGCRIGLFANCLHLSLLLAGVTNVHPNTMVPLAGPWP